MADAANGRFFGTIKWYNSAKGYGFIRSDEPLNGSGDLYLPERELSEYEPLLPGERVSFLLGGIGPGKRPFARQVVRE